MKRQKQFLVFLIALTLAICFAMVRSYLGYILTGLILALLLLPLKQRLDNRMKPTYSSSIVVILTVLGAILPLIITAGFVAEDASNVIQSLNQTQPGETLLSDIGISGLEDQVENITGRDVALQESITSALRSIGSFIVSSSSQIVGFAGSFTIGLSIILFVEFYGLRDGVKTVEWMKKFDVLPNHIQRDLFQDTARTTKAVVKGHLLIALLTGLMTGLGLFLTGVPNAIFWSFVSIIAGLIPVIGVALIWVPAAAYLLLTGSSVAAAALALYAIVIIGGTENFLRPYLVDEEANLHPLYILLGVIGGISIFGIVGIFIGPIIFGITISLMNIYRRSQDRFSQANTDKSMDDQL